MRTTQAVRNTARRAAEPSPVAAVAAADIGAGAACVPVALRPDTRRAGTTLVDLTGDGLVVSAVPTAQVQAVLGRAGQTGVDIAQPSALCLSQGAVRQLVQPLTQRVAKRASLVVASNGQVRLLSTEQWQTQRIAKNTSERLKAARLAKAQANKQQAAAGGSPVAQTSGQHQRLLGGDGLPESVVANATPRTLRSSAAAARPQVAVRRSDRRTTSGEGSPRVTPTNDS